jgi:hypothetical protein
MAKNFVQESNDETVDIEFGDYELENSDENVDTDEHNIQNPFNPAEINISSKQDTLLNLLNRVKHNEIDMNTDFQRHAELWDTRKMSRLIESILIRLPLPAFYFDASDDENWLIVDGLQRLSAIRKFVLEEDARKKLKLRDLEYLGKQFNGKTYDDLPRTYKRRIDECPVTLFLIQKGTPEAVKYSVFRRINTGGIVLNDQEIRNAMAKPSIRKWIEELAKDEYLINIFGDRSERMMDQELVLRFLAFHYQDYEKSTKNITSFIDEMIEKLEKVTEKQLNEYKDAFKRATKRCWQIFGESAFEKQIKDAPTRRKRKSSPLFEVWTNALVDVNERDVKTLIQRKELLIEKHTILMSDDSYYFRSITYSTQKKDHFRTRRDKVNQLIMEILNA